VKWELDLWYEMWDRAGSQGLDTWYELPHGKRRGGGREANEHPAVDRLDEASARSESADGGRE
jgi:hypothetical protein